MTEKILTFKEYMASKEKLLEPARKNIPEQTVNYSVRKYCKLVLGESKLEKMYIPLKPKQQVSVKWLYDDLENPTPLEILFNGVSDVPEEERFTTFWEGEKLRKWLDRNTHED